jgi:polar amino acid transport system substrate-binding protein
MLIAKITEMNIRMVQRRDPQGRSMFRYLRSLAISLATAALIAAQAPSEPSKPSLVIAAEDGAGPWGQPDGTGCGNEIVLAAYAAAKVPAKLEIVPYSRAKSGVLDGHYVACFGMAWTPDLKGKVVFADKPLYSVTAMLVQSVAKPLKASSVKDLPTGTRIGTVYEYEYPPVFYDLVKRGTITPMSSYSEVISLKNLDQDRVDAALVVIDELKNLDYLIAAAGLAGKVKQAFAIGGQSTYIGFSTAHPQFKLARSKFNEGFAIIVKDGTLKKIMDTWKAKQH